METCPKIEVVLVPKSYRKTISRSIEMFLEMQKVELIEGDVWGHRKDINEYYTVPPSLLRKIKDLKAEGLPAEIIAEEVSNDSKLNPKMVLYILNRKQIE